MVKQQKTHERKLKHSDNHKLNLGIIKWKTI